MQVCIIIKKTKLNLKPPPLHFSFIVFIPEWKDPPLQCLSKLDESHFKRKQVVVMGMEHEYRHGYQWIISKYSQVKLVFHKLRIYFNF